MRYVNAGIVAGLMVIAVVVSGVGSASASTDTGSGPGSTAGMGTSESPTGDARASIAAAVANPPASATTLSSGLNGFDNIGADSPATLQCLSDAGYSFDVIDALGTGWDTEYRSAAAIGMSVVLFQGFFQPFWSDPNQGTARGQLMVSNAQLVGYPQGAQVYLNLENNLTDGTNPVTRATMIQWVQNWAAVVTAAGYMAGVYVGVPQLLTSSDLDTAIPNVGVLWRSASGSAPQSAKGYVLRQPAISQSQCGVTIDTDTASSDNHGAGLVGAGFPRGATTPAVAGAIGPLSPARIADTRGSGGVLAGTASRVQILGAGGVPGAGVSAVMLNLTVTNATASGFLTAYPNPAARPLASNLNFAAGQTVPNLVVVPVGADGAIRVYNGSATAVDIIADVAGFYLGGAPTAAGTFGALTPQRIADTRGGGAVPAGTASKVQILGAGGVPGAGVSAVMLNLTVTNATASGFLTAYPNPAARPLASNLNFTAGQTVANLVVVPVAADGTIQVYNGAPGTVDIIADVAGYYLGGGPTATGTFGALTPHRIADTRGGGSLPAGTARALQVTGQGGVPTSGVAGVVMNLTATTTAGAGFVTAWPSGSNRPLASNLNFTAGQTVPNLVVVPVGTDGKVMLFNGSSASLDLIADVVGYIVG